MGERDVARIDPSAVREIAQRCESVADTLSVAVAPLLRWYFDGFCGGRDHAAQAAALRIALDESADQVRSWVRATSEAAAALRVSSGRYVDADADLAGRLV
ncbi:ESX-1 secretion-associated protein [Mycobacterium sp. CBMA293]|uniref:type VII secretion target n=1 Tax=unclassified Mycolicibacterium TaxID=2636767 RepID=UPI0012DF84C9|nr:MULTISPECIES: type VII secretion target [unclassified Mycolicibacterium]MUL48517.1 ESX-1 secretion-associated protein [Mycolicibacterium sp. CBMA 360]MUL61974.1 ESX-1 secretion-associated protein [Mycolicibacterium sp. CBMA 335]MUL73249.1 ESX-1 secretion-associated protein [Mycolicibacterium sp. CBMA 311]MUL96418.1 ESX-1 secretion-associated protein [Mycolicibacterium sp. CBMA 230]MUM14516.1 ESX-1 secretion-associated protein [Mycolicibacterium sp. CBMA 293]